MLLRDAVSRTDVPRYRLCAVRSGLRQPGCRMGEMFTVITMPSKGLRNCFGDRPGGFSGPGGVCFRVILVVIWLLSAVYLTAQVPREINLGLISDSQPVTVSFIVQNPSPSRVVRFDFLCGSSSLSLEPDRLVLDPLESTEVQVTYKPEGYMETLFRQILIKSNLVELDNRRIVVTADFPAIEIPPVSYCDECLKFEELFNEETRLSSYENSVVQIDLYLEPACKGCLQYFNQELPPVALEAGKLVRVAQLDSSDPKRLAQLKKRLRRHGSGLEIMPVAFVDGKVYQGLQAIKSGIRAALILEKNS